MSESQKEKAAVAACAFIENDSIVGVGTGSTVNYFIKALADFKHKIEAAVASSEASTQLLKKYGVPVIDLNSVNSVPLYIDGADEVTALKQMIKGGGGALTREKILASVAKQFVCIVDESKKVGHLGEFPVAVEVIPMARSYVARQIVMLGGDPMYRQGFVTDNGNIILDIHQLTINKPLAMESAIKAITGVVECGIFAKRAADVVLIGTDNGVLREA